MPTNQVLATGRIVLSNYETAALTVGQGAAMLLANGVHTSFENQITNGVFELKIHHTLDMLSDDDCRRTISEIEEAIVLACVIQNGYGFRVIIDKFVRHDGRELKAQNDNIQIPQCSVRNFDLFALIGACYPLRVALRDFNSGLMHRDDCPIHFYRALDTIVRMFADKSGDAKDLKGADWDYIRQRLGISFDENHILIQLAKKHRHSFRDKFETHDHIEMMRLTKEVLAKTCEELARNPTSRAGVSILATLPA